MAFGKPKTRISPIGIDFGADSVKLLQIIPGDPPQLVALGAATIPEEARQDANLRMAFLAEALPNLLRRHPFRNRRVVLSIPSFQAMVHNVIVPDEGDEDLDSLVRMALQERLEINADDLILRNFPGAEIMRGDQKMREVIVFGARRNVATRYADLANRMKLEVVGMHGEAPCILKAFGHLESARTAKDRGRAVVYIDLGAATSKLIVAQGGAMVLAKTIHAGGDNYTRRLAGEKSIAFEEARLARMTSGGAVATASAQSSASCDITECLVDELRMVVRHYEARYPKQPIEKLVFVGGEANRHGLVSELARSVRLAAQMGDPFARLSRVGGPSGPLPIDLSQPQPGWAVPLGLCLSEEAV
ncbi:MAG: pilus assembly protein PilM [Algisphaera sp.]